MAKKAFEKFINKPVKGAKIKEAFRQEKKAAIKERRDAIEKHYEEKRKLKAERFSQGNSNESRPFKDNKKNVYKNNTINSSFKKQFEKKDNVLKKRKSDFYNDTSSAKPYQKPFERKSSTSYKGKSSQASVNGMVTNEMPLNKFIAHAGVCSRRDAADLVRKGNITVNGEKVSEPAFKVTDDAVVKIDGKKISRSKNQVYILLNKPKDYITTADDPQGRKTVMDIIKNATTERVYPVGRLDRNTSGVLLLTNDGDLAQKLSHPSFEVRKIYEVKLNKVLQKDDFEKILSGVKLEDGEVHADSLAYADKDKSVVGIEIHSGKNRVVRRIFEKLGYDVRNLDRVMYANLTKKNVERGKWRFLSEKEIRLLKYFNKSKQEKKMHI